MLGRKEDLRLDSLYFSPGMEGVIKVKQNVKDLGIQVDDNPITNARGRML